VADISEISWSPVPFDCLTIPSEKKDVIMALAQNRIGRTVITQFDDFVARKGRGLNVLLLYVPQIPLHLRPLTHETVVHQESERL
jgi:hypothetical protein